MDSHPDVATAPLTFMASKSDKCSRSGSSGSICGGFRPADTPDGQIMNAPNIMRVANIDLSLDMSLPFPRSKQREAENGKKPAYHNDLLHTRDAAFLVLFERFPRARRKTDSIPKVIKAG